MDQEFASRSPFGRRVVHGMLLASHFSTLVGMHLPGTSALYMSQEVRFAKPAFVGDRVRVHGRVVAMSAGTRVLTLSTQILDARGEVIVDGEAKVMVVEPGKEQPLPAAPASLSLTGQVALVTGGSRGIGAATAMLLARHGAAVAVNYRERRAEADQVEREITSAGGRAFAVQADVADRSAVERMVKEVAARLGPIRIVVNNAAPALTPARVDQTSWADVERDLATTVGGAYHCIQAALPGMVDAGGGAIVNVLSSVVIGAPPPQQIAYVTAKHALLGMTRALAVELGVKGIRVNAVAPGLTDTALTAYVPQRLKDVVAHQTPLRRLADPADTASAIVFLASDAAGFLNGVCLPVTGGAAMV